MVDEVMFSTSKDEWETPQDLFNALDARFGFSLDAAATALNAKHNRYYTKEDDALAQEWGSVTWCNPPFGKGDKLADLFVAKGHQEAMKGKTVVMLLAARTDTARWHDHIMGYADEVHLIRGRLKFKGGEHVAAFPSCVVVWQFGGTKRETKFYAMERDGSPTS
jgi:site-specific DNA-methyltransferase (adenine-specific)